jgi:hypothetical protein
MGRSTVENPWVSLALIEKKHLAFLLYFGLIPTKGYFILKLVKPG